LRSPKRPDRCAELRGGHEHRRSPTRRESASCRYGAQPHRTKESPRRRRDRESRAPEDTFQRPNPQKLGHDGRARSCGDNEAWQKTPHDATLPGPGVLVNVT
jgi:hypothetical protein